MAEDKTVSKEIAKEVPKVTEQPKAANAQKDVKVQPKAEKEAPKVDGKKTVVVEESVMTINLRKHMGKSPSWRRTEDAVGVLRSMLDKKTKTKVVIDKKLNEKIWSVGIKNPQTKWRVKIIKNGEVTRAELME